MVGVVGINGIGIEQLTLIHGRLFSLHNGQILECNAFHVTHIHTTQIIHAKDPLGQNTAFDLILGQLQRGGVHDGLSMLQGQTSVQVGHDVASLLKEKGGIPSECIGVGGIPRAIPQITASIGSSHQNTGGEGISLASRLHGGGHLHRQGQVHALVVSEGLFQRGQDITAHGVPGIGQTAHDSARVGHRNGGRSHLLVPRETFGIVNGGVSRILLCGGGKQAEPRKSGHAHDGGKEKAHQSFDLHIPGSFLAKTLVTAIIAYFSMG